MSVVSKSIILFYYFHVTNLFVQFRLQFFWLFPVLLPHAEEYPGKFFQRLLFPFAYLVRRYSRLTRNLGYRSLTLYCFQSNFRFERSIITLSLWSNKSSPFCIIILHSQRRFHTLFHCPIFGVHYCLGSLRCNAAK